MSQNLPLIKSTQFVPKALTSDTLSLDAQEPWAHLSVGMINCYARRHEEAIDDLSKALKLNPNSSLAYLWLGLVYGYSGQVELALESLDRAYQISPRDPFNQSTAIFKSVALFTARRDVEARDLAREAVKAQPELVGAWRLLAITCALLGELEEARFALAEVKRLQPTISLAWGEKFGPWARAEDLKRYLEGLKLAGLE